MAHLTGVRGDTIVRTATITQPDGTAYDLTGCTVWFTVKEVTDRAANDDEALALLYWISGGASNGIAVSAPATGVVTVTIPASTTATLSPGRAYRYDLQIEDPLNAVATPDRGTLIVTRDVTLRVTTP